MKEELETIKKDIEDLEQRLLILRKREEAIRSKLEIPTEWIGKYIMNTDQMYIYYKRIDSITRSKNGTFIAEGPAIIIEHQLSGIKYTLYSKQYFSLNTDTFIFVTKEEFDEELENALKSFK